ncbi:murein biosynthesis integral membrane protein MurJ [Streptomyces sp. NBC_00083]|uniref:murein biosynthesis integral membrane protein MurJ n=1 Tax=Streptomyces sp. NBC_00083 TaxID=2975647 RepID=UPI0022535CE2|nr:murein biosynthesis integral membrane protein MurJ [Streptomyces sp. NBC_00083]MCX5386502.1 murein biosynthesis integral membrane protein MurJ [Streptomyces sp. NBC_00083]
MHGRDHQQRALPRLPGVSGTPVTTTAAPAGSASAGLLRSSALMAAGSVVSRATGFVRSAVIAAALGVGLLGDGYAVANNVPNILYMLLIGGTLNAVFVPELVRAAKEHSDGGAAYTDRLMTACACALAVITALAVLAAPAIVHGYTDYSGAQADLTIALARYCLPQILFYGLFTLFGQVLNARGRFGAMMWTPVLNNIVVIAVFGSYLALAAQGGGTLSAGDARLLGWGTTAGIAVQALALVPSLRAARFRWRPRFDWRGHGLGRPLRSAGWAVLLVVSNQLAYWVVTRLSTTAGAEAVREGVGGGAGYTAYTNAYVLWMVPHGIVTVSLVTALMPKMSRASADGDLAQVRRDLSYGLRTCAAVIVPAACALFALAPWILGSVYAYGRTGSGDIAIMAGMLMAFAPGLVALSGQYVLSRGFYALGDTRTPFLLNLVISGLNAALTVVAYAVLPARWAVTGIAGAYTVALCAGLAATAYTLNRRLGGGPLVRSPAVLAHLRLLLACVPAAALGYGAARAADPLGSVAGAGAGTVALVVVLALLARPLGLTDINAVLDKVRPAGRVRPAGGRHRAR